MAACAPLHVQLWGQNVLQHQKSQGHPQREELTLGEADGFKR